ncbi:MAG: flagellar export protein FliJ [Armatimonadota bacterium]|nr:MAG: flagellar export protein FliJ [Armatimonadota bacterium]
MRRFVFSLQKVLDYRQQREEQAVRAFAEAQAQLLHEQAVLHRLLSEREGCLRRSHRRQRLAVELLDVEQAYLSALEERIEAQRGRVVEAVRVLEEKRQALTQAQRERKALERLREKHYEQWRQEMLRIEQKALDELATARSVRSPGILNLHAGGGEHE